MMRDDFLQKYYFLNTSYKKKFIYHFGSGQGFYSELNSMFFCMLYCLKFKIQFILYSEDSHFASGNGWDDIFIPFENSTKSWVHHYCNNRSDNYDKTSFSTRLVKFAYKEITKNYLMDDIFTDTRTSWFEKQFIDIPELTLIGNIKECMRVMISEFYRFNSRVSEKISKRIVDVKLPEEYLAVHIRLGDKARERKLLTTESYISRIKRTDYKNIFVLTDDYSSILELQQQMPDRKIFTLCQSNQRGYDNQKFLRLSNIEREEQLLILLSSVEIMKKSAFFIGTYSANPGLFLSMCLQDEQVDCLDYDHWLII